MNYLMKKAVNLNGQDCHNAVQILEYAKSRRVPVYQMADCNLLVPLNKKR